MYSANKFQYSAVRILNAAYMGLFLLSHNILRSSVQIQHVTKCSHSITFSGVTLLFSLDRKL